VRFMRWLQTLALVALLVPMQGCFLFFLLGGETVDGVSDLVDRIFASLDAEAATSFCISDDSLGFGCTYTVDGSILTSTAVLVSELGLFGVLVDPIVLELPDDATDFVGSYDDGGANAGDLVIHRNLSVVPVDDQRQFEAGAGKQLVVVDLPPGAPVDGITYRFSLDFQREVPAGTGPTPLRAFFTGRVETGGKVFYPPLYPCTTDLGSLPELTLPRSGLLEEIELPTELPVCSNEVYTYFFWEGQREKSCDLDNDTDADADDLALIMAVRNLPAGAGDPRDTNEDGAVDANDARHCAERCTRPLCAVD